MHEAFQSNGSRIALSVRMKRIHTRREPSNMWRGAFAGLVATVPMTMTMQALRAWLPAEQARSMPPREIVDRTINKTGEGHAVEEPERTALTTIGHLAFGAAAGAV